MKKDLLKLLDNVTLNSNDSDSSERYLLIDGLNLFFRNFTAINTVNSQGAHIGGVGGFFRSLGSLIHNIQPTQVVVLFDGMGSSNNRKNLIPEYKSDRSLTRVTKHELFDSLEEEDESKISQIVRIIEYLHTLPVKTLSIKGVEADDVIAYLSTKLPSKPTDRVFIVSSDKDYLQLITEQIIVYRPIEKEFYTTDTIIEKFNLPPENFILMKTLLGDSSDSISGIKGLGNKKLFKLFPELSEHVLTFNELIDICENKIDDHIIYAKIIKEIEQLKIKYKVMDLSNPMIDENTLHKIDTTLDEYQIEFHPDMFVEMYNEDQLGGLIRNVEFWVKNTFKDLCR